MYEAITITEIKLKLNKAKVGERRNLHFDTKQLEDNHIRGEFSIDLQNCKTAQNWSYQILKCSGRNCKRGNRIEEQEKKKNWLAKPHGTTLSKEEIEKKASKYKIMIKEQAYTQKDKEIIAPCYQDRCNSMMHWQNKLMQLSHSNDLRTLQNHQPRWAAKGTRWKTNWEKEKIQRWKNYLAVY